MLAESVGREAPIDQVVENSVDVVAAAILKVQVLGVFPNVDGLQRLHVLGQWRHCISGLDHLELAGRQCQPRPAAEEEYYLLRRFQSTKTMSATMATVMITPVHIPVSKTSPMTPQPDITDNSGAKPAILKCLIICAPG